MKTHEDRIARAAETAVRKAGEILRSHADRQLKVAASTQHDFKLEVDVLSERAILDVISSAFPDHAILAEESGTTEGAGDYLWIIDPLDGTVNFYYGLPYYCVSIACFARPGGQPPPAARGVESLDISLIDPDKSFEFEVPAYNEYQELESQVEVPLPGVL